MWVRLVDEVDPGESLCWLTLTKRDHVKKQSAGDKKVKDACRRKSAWQRCQEEKLAQVAML